jgi:hypothetical protein
MAGGDLNLTASLGAHGRVARIIHLPPGEIGHRLVDSVTTTIWHKRYSPFWGHLRLHPAAVLSCRQDQDASLIEPRRFGEWTSET